MNNWSIRLLVLCALIGGMITGATVFFLGGLYGVLLSRVLDLIF